MSFEIVKKNMTEMLSWFKSIEFCRVLLNNKTTDQSFSTYSLLDTKELRCGNSVNWLYNSGSTVKYLKHKSILQLLQAKYKNFPGNCMKIQKYLTKNRDNVS